MESVLQHVRLERSKQALAGTKVIRGEGTDVVQNYDRRNQLFQLKSDGAQMAFEDVKKARNKFLDDMGVATIN